MTDTAAPTSTPIREAFKVEPQSAINSYRLVNAAHLPDTPDRKPLVDGFLYNTDTMLLFAPAGGFKSMVAIHLAVAVANGGTFMGQQAHKGRVLFVDGELSAYSFKQRFELFGDSASLDILSECYQDPTKLHTLDPIHLEESTVPRPARATERRKLEPAEGSTRRKDWQSAILTLVERNGYSLVVFDNVRTLTGDINENDAADIAPLNTLVKRLRYIGCAVLVVHHARKAEDEDGHAVFAGTSNFMTVYNTTLGIEKVAPEIIRFEVHKDRENSISDYFRETAWKLSDVPGTGFVQTDAESAQRAQMVDLMRRLDGGEFSTRGAFLKSARRRHGIQYRSTPSAIKALHAVLAEEAVVPDEYSTFNSRVSLGVAAACGEREALKEDF